MTIVRTVRAALRAAQGQQQSVFRGLIWAADDLRSEALEACYNAGIPPLLLANLGDLPELFGRAEYAYKTQWHEFLLAGCIDELIRGANHEAWRDWQ